MEGSVKLSMIVARSRNGIIGRDGGLPWKLSDDLKFFKRTTMGHPIIMGRHTWESLPRKPLPGRQNIVISKDWAYAAIGARVYSNLNAAINAAKAIANKDGVEEVFIIGGQSLFERAMPLTDILYISEVDAEIDGDVSFPGFDESEFEEVATSRFEAGERNEYPFTLRVLQRVQD
ncbi:dihydrofolate reductase [Henriciella aquimarina]|uniref:dihydrofolate reductase n=1 Tax=Henriciella aquimarina TaxID=545261 RepID=UPI00117A7268|nr:dihydrofolate reductase [Henriciella aquimarina]